MKKLGKLSLKQMETEMSVMGSDEQKIFIGGSSDASYQMLNGTVVNYDGYCVYNGNGGETYVFEGVNVSGCTYCAPDAAYQYGGNIKVGANWGGQFDVQDLTHEYGHHLQQQELGGLAYAGISVVSAWDLLMDGASHDELDCEQDATNRGNDYMYGHYGTTY